MTMVLLHDREDSCLLDQLSGVKGSTSVLGSGGREDEPLQLTSAPPNERFGTQLDCFTKGVNDDPLRLRTTQC